MKTVTIEGEVYTKVSILADKFGYTGDYIGQLCRSNKVEARLIGRAWYVNEYSLNKHKDTRYVTLRANEKISKLSSELVSVPHVPKTVVKPTLSKLTKRSILNPDNYHWITRTEILPESTYFHDDHDLVPEAKITNAPVELLKPAKIPVELSDATKVSIKVTEKNPYEISFSDLPEVSLQGQVTIEDLNEDLNEEEDGNDEKLVSANSLPLRPLNKMENKSFSSSSQLAHLSTLSPKSYHFTPNQIKPPATGRSVSLIPITFMLAFVIALLVITLDTQIVTDGFAVNHHLIFTSASLQQIFTIFGF